MLVLEIALGVALGLLIYHHGKEILDALEWPLTIAAWVMLLAAIFFVARNRVFPWLLAQDWSLSYLSSSAVWQSLLATLVGAVILLGVVVLVIWLLGPNDVASAWRPPSAGFRVGRAIGRCLGRRSKS